MTISEGCFHLLIPHLDHQGCLDALYLLPDGDGWRLPSLMAPVRFGRPDEPTVLRRAVRENLGLDTTVLYWPARSQEGDSQACQFLAVLDVHEVLAASAGRWQSARALPALSLPAASLDAAFRSWLAAEVDGEAPALRAPWAKAGWLAGVSSWIDNALGRMGIARTAPVEQKRTWSISCMLRISTTVGEFYYKAVPDLFAREPRLTAALATSYPGEVPEVAAVDEDRHGMLMRAFAGRHLEESDDLPTWQGALRRYAQIQQDSATARERWYQLGCADRRLTVLSAQMDTLFADRPALEAGGRLSAGEIETLPGLAPRLRSACNELEAFGLPYVLEHGDLHANNIFMTAGGYLYFDWTDGCITHPFFCLLPFLEFVPAAWHDALIDAYLAQWTHYLPSQELRRAMRLARPLGALHMALSYRDISNATEPTLRWELEGGVAAFVKQLLRFQDGLESLAD